MRHIVIAIICSLWACSTEQVAKPRPHQYPRIEVPQTGSATVNPPNCPLTMTLPDYASIVSKEQDEDAHHPCWFDIRLEPFNSTIHCSYYPITAEKNYDELVEDAYTMASKHNVKAYYRDEILIQTKSGSRGIIFKIEGPVATPYQFYLTDSTSHFLRGSLYFDQKIELDSMQAIIQIVETQVDDIVGSIDWQ